MLPWRGDPRNCHVLLLDCALTVSCDLLYIDVTSSGTYHCCGIITLQHARRRLPSAKVSRVAMPPNSTEQVLVGKEDVMEKPEFGQCGAKSSQHASYATPSKLQQTDLG